MISGQATIVTSSAISSPSMPLRWVTSPTKSFESSFSTAAMTGALST
jgi:hypothetical protein